MKEGVKQLTGGERYFVHLPPKKQRDAERLDRWVDEAIEVFRFRQKGEER